MFDESLGYNNDDIILIEKELNMLGFKKYKTSEKSFIFRSAEYNDYSINKNYCDEENIDYTFSICDNYIGSLYNKERGSVTNKKEEYYKKYFNNKVRKYKIDKLLNL
jgi:hypothetical protein